MAAKINIPIPSRGLVVDRPAEFNDPRSISNCRNITVDRNIVGQRLGGNALGVSLGERILGAAELDTGSTTYFVRVGLTKAEVIDKTSLAWTSITHAALTAVAESQVFFAFPLLAAERIMVYTNGVDAIRKYTGSGNDADLGGTPPTARFLLDFGGYLVLANVTDSGTERATRVQWSDTGDPENWDPVGSDAGSEDLLEDSTPITALSRFGNYLTVHKENCVYLGQLTDTTEVFRFTRKEGNGAAAQGSIQNLPDGTQIYLARDGLRLFNGNGSIQIPSSINAELRSSMNPQWIKRATSVVVQDLDEYWVGIAVGSQTEPETIYKYNYKTGEMYKDDRPGLMAMSLYKLTSDESWATATGTWATATRRWDSVTELALYRQVVASDKDGLCVLKTNSVNDNGAAVDSIWDTKDFTSADVMKGMSTGTMVRWTSLTPWFLGNKVYVYYSIDSGLNWTLARSIDLDSDYPGDGDPDVVYFDVLSSKIRFRFRNANVGETWSLKQYVLGYSIREERL